MNLQQTIDQIAAQLGIDPTVAEKAAGTILSVIQQELDPNVATQLFAKLPGAAELASAHTVTSSGGTGGLLASLASSVLGSKAGTLAAGFAQLESTGLTMPQIEAAAGGVLAFVKANAGTELATHITGAIPGLAPQR
jgi:Protein of unknown function VcgC/VcgE (DUF2780)